ncbi:hypothetical protein Dxin01_02790 [Deinococcus xinjiangensis]|uniref:SpoVT-AbrB domain-containing protein n=1 Tax=Deinococcus xinjiangensis TaxID=457454 RepID=A0ABP9VCS4_9DEIO
MTTTPTTFELEIDKFGRVLIPKKVREALNLRAGSKLKADLSGTALTLEAEAPRYEIRYSEGGWPVVHFLDAQPWPEDEDPIKACRDERTAELLKTW